MKFGAAMRIKPPMTDNQKVKKKIKKSKMADGGHLENRKLRHLQNRLADFDEIWYDDPY